MGFISEHTRRILIAVTIAFFISGGGFANAQELIIPEKWRMSSAKPLFTPDTLTVRILGDIMMHQKQIENALRDGGSYDFDSYFRFIADDIKEADISIANMEFTLAGEPYSGYPCFSAPDSFAGYLAGCGFDVWLAANNHIFDKGTPGAVRTLEIYRRLSRTHGISFTGLAGNEEELEANNPLTIRRKGIKLALLNFTYGTNTGLQTYWPKTNYTGEREKLERAFSKAREEGADFIMALPHWGQEYVLRHSEKQEKEAVWLAGNGADWIIGMHPHVIQDTASVKGVPVAYSLGNAVSNMSAVNTQLELMATVRIVREKNGDLKALPMELEYLWCSRPGGYDDSYTIIPVIEFLGRKGEWQNAADYHKMVAAYERVRKETGIYNDKEKH